MCSALIWAFTGGGLAVSTFVRNQAKAVMILLGIWVASVALLDFLLIGVMLQWRLNPQSVFLLAALNPVEASRLALLSSAEHRCRCWVQSASTCRTTSARHRCCCWACSGRRPWAP